MPAAVERLAREARALVVTWLGSDLDHLDDAHRATVEALGHLVMESVVEGDTGALTDWLSGSGRGRLPSDVATDAVCRLLTRVREHAAGHADATLQSSRDVGTACDTVLVASVAALTRRDSGMAVVDIAAVVTDTLYSRTPTGSIRFVSAGVHGLTGLEPDELMAAPPMFDRLLVEEDAPRLADLHRLVRARREPMEAVYRVNHHASGRVLHVLDRATPVLSASGDVSHINGLMIDITDRVELEARLERSEQLRSLGQLARDVAHDFNNLLVSVLGHADLLTTLLPEDSREASYLRLIVSACERGSKLSERLLQFARGASHSDARGPIDVPLTASEATELARPAAPPHVLLDVINIAGAPLITGDGARLGEAILNIVLNAIHACEPTEKAHVSVTVRPAHGGETFRIGADAGCVVEVTDDGPGMSPDVAARVFEPLFTTKVARGGSGLGCAMAYGIAVDHGGVLEVESTPGSGTTFRFILPSSDPAAPPPPPVPPTPEQATALATRPIARPRPASREEDQRSRILVVDDEPSVRFLLRDLLEGAGFRVTTASGGQEAIDHVRDQPALVDIAILDVMMAPMDGTETFAVLKQMAPTLPIIFCTGHSDASRLAAPGVLANATIVQKPFRAAQLIRAVREAISSTPEAEQPSPP